MSDKPDFVCRTTVEGYDLTFKWWGGAYIDICWRGGEAFDVINVWDYAKDEPTIERTPSAFVACVREWINDPDASHAHDLANYAML